MRRIFAAAAVCACACAFASDLKTSAYESARAAEGELAEFGRVRAEKISEKKAELDALSAQIRALRGREEALRSALAERASLASASAFCDSRAGELAADIGEFSASFFPASAPFAPRSSAAECLQKLESESGAWLEKLFNPLAPAPFSAKLPGSREKIAGKMFRVGAFEYFVSPTRAGFLDSSGVLYGEKFAPEIRAFFAGESNVLPADVSGGAIFAADRNARDIFEEISLGGIWMYPILFLGFLSAAVFAYKLAYFARVRRAPEGIARRVKELLARSDEDGALEAARSAGYPYSRLLLDLARSRGLPRAALEEVSYESMLEAGERLFSGLSVLSVSAAVAPLLGLLGTVTGIIKTFGDLSFSGAGQAQFISAGISEALITTEYGLVVAIPAYVAHAVFSRRAKSVLSDMEKLASSYLSGD
ncbi:MAG: hypothetical protein BHW65_00640 [Verrucomicrobia bacterium CAG:312_58_20]|nr:MAG: hypothetical protein BHW65_00640 [Verrucomicrobia bacterium CAG:312_58_20]